MEEKSEEIPSEPTTNNHSSTSPTEQYTDARSPHFKNIVHLWEFLLELLSDDHFKSLITWTRKDYREFKLKDKEEVAKRWGLLKGKKGMNYEKLSRALRYYYQYGIIKKVPGQRLVYKFDKLPYKYVPGVTRSSYQVQMIHGSIPTQKPKPCSTFARPNRFTSGSSLNNSAPPRRHSARRSSSPLKLLSHDSSVPSRRISFDHTSAPPRRFSPDHTSVPVRRFSGSSRDAPLPSAMSPTESPLRKSWSWPVKVEPGQRSSWCQSHWDCEMPGVLSGSRIIFPVGGPIALFPRSVAESEPESKVHPTAQSVAVPVIMWAAQTPAEKS